MYNKTTSVYEDCNLEVTILNPDVRAYTFVASSRAKVNGHESGLYSKETLVCAEMCRMKLDEEQKSNKV